MGIVRDKGILGGTPIIEGTRIPVYIMIYTATSFADEIAAGFPTIDEQQVKEALTYAAVLLERMRLPKEGE